MNTGLKIKDVAEASGFTAATLRYYEHIGLLPEAARTPSGYRIYDQRTLDRLAFIARAKQLGCTLEEITGLTTAWDGGRCGPIQDQLRQLVAGKIDAAHEQIVELMTFTGELRRAATALERHRPSGGCDEQCGCLGDPLDVDGGDAAHPVHLTAKPAPPGAPPIACTLEAGAMEVRLDDWQALLEHVERRAAIDGGVRCEFAPSVPHAELMRLVATEQACCRFFEFSITVDRRGVGLDVRAPGDAHSIVESMFGAAG